MAKAKKLFQGAELDKVKDDLLLEMTASGRREAFEVLYERHNDPLYRFLFRILLNEQTTLEVIQETWMKVHKNCAIFNGKASFKTWLYTIAKNTAFDHLKKKKDFLMEEANSVEEFPQDDESALERLVREATREKVRGTLEQLSPDQKSVLAMWMEDIPLLEMAEIMERTPQAVKNLIHRSKRNLKTLLEGDGHE